MPSTTNEDIKEQEFADDAPKNRVGVDISVKDQKDSYENDEYPMPSLQEEEEVIKIKYQGIIPKKLPLLSKRNARLYFDSADWAMGKPQGALRPKWELTIHQPVLSKFAPHACTHYGKDSKITSVVPDEDQSSHSKQQCDNNHSIR